MDRHILIRAHTQVRPYSVCGGIIIQLQGGCTRTFTLGLTCRLSCRGKACLAPTFGRTYICVNPCYLRHLRAKKFKLKIPFIE